MNNMNDTRARLAAVGALMAGAALATLAGCGGGGAAASTTPPPPPPPPTAEAAYLVAGEVSDASGAFSLQVFDPANPARPVEAVALGGSNNGWLAYVPETTYDAATNTVTTPGNAQLLYLDQGRLMQVDLRGGHDHSPRQITSGSDICSLPFTGGTPPQPLSRDGQDAWVTVTRGDCSMGNTGNVAWVRTTGGAAARVVAAPGTAANYARGLEDATGLFAGLLTTTTDDGSGTYAAAWFDRELNAVPIAGASVRLPSWLPSLAGDPTTPQAGWLVATDGVHRVSWTTSTFTVGALVHPLRTAVRAISGAPDGLYVGDGIDVWHVDALGIETRVGTMPGVGGNDVDFGVLAVASTSSRTFFTNGATDFSWGDGLDNVTWVDAAGAFHTVTEPDALTTLRVVGQRGDVALVLRAQPGIDASTGSTVDWSLRLARLAADGAITALPDAMSSVVSNRHVVGAAAETVATWECPEADSLAQWPPCQPGSVVQRDLVDGSTLTLGAVNRSFDYGWTWDAAVVQDVAVTRTICHGACDLYLVRPGHANSLVRLTFLAD
jgi:hypothetical protein